MAGEQQATVAEEEYLQTIFWLQEAGLPMTGANVARAMQLSAPTVHEMVGRLERDGYITRAADKAISFTDERLEHAKSPVLEARMLAAIGDAKTCPHGHPIEPGQRIAGVPLGDVAPGAKVTVLRFENEAEDLLHLFKEEGLEPGREGTVETVDDEQVVVDFGAV